MFDAREVAFHPGEVAGNGVSRAQRLLIEGVALGLHRRAVGVALGHPCLGVRPQQGVGLGVTRHGTADATGHGRDVDVPTEAERTVAGVATVGEGECRCVAATGADRQRDLQARDTVGADRGPALGGAWWCAAVGQRRQLDR